MVEKDNSYLILIFLAKNKMSALIGWVATECSPEGQYEL